MDQFEGKPLLNKCFEEVDAKAKLENKILGLYFSASWCPPCQQFVKILAAAHNELQKRNSSFEVVFLSSDKTEEDMKDFVSSEHGDWYMLPFADSRIQELQDQFLVTMIPKLIILRPDGEIITTKGRKELQDRGIAAFRSWSAAVDHAAAQHKQAIEKQAIEKQLSISFIASSREKETVVKPDTEVKTELQSEQCSTVSEATEEVHPNTEVDSGCVDTDRSSQIEL